MQATPTTWRMLLDWGWRPLPRFKALCGGEALPVTLAEELLERGLELWNMYGPTETTIWSTVAPLRSDEPLTIGRPIANTTVFVLDARLQPVPPPIAGELHIGGEGLARGYRNRPDLTAERFLETPFGRIYKTGDLVRYRTGGELEYLGRLDHQVKVRGFRIELGEIETVLARHESVQRAVCVARDDGEGLELVAYVVPRGIPVAPAHLRRYVAAHLPPYMVPKAIIALPAFPLTPNGKVDRKGLPAPARERLLTDEVVAPRTPLERKLVAIWEHVLDIRPIGVTDNFFDLGATSIAAARLFAQIEHELGDSLPLGAAFRAPTIEQLAELIESPDDASRWTSLVPIQPLGERRPIFCVHGGAGTILHLEPLARRLGPEQPFFGLQSRGLYGGAPPLQTVEAMAAHYLAEAREVQPHGPYVLGGYCFGAIVAYEMAQRLLAEGEEVSLLISFNGPSPSWIQRWGWFGNQPSHRARRLTAQPRLTREEKVRRAIREPFRIRRFLVYEAKMRLGRAKKRLDRGRVRLALAANRPIPEEIREGYFLGLHAKAERRYQPRPYPHKMLLFFGQGLYEDPLLGWRDFVSDLETYAVPGEHDNNRQAMNEPYVTFVHEQLIEALRACQ
jgi:thioesterase domain-containing protein/acyl carrier protein